MPTSLTGARSGHVVRSYRLVLLPGQKDDSYGVVLEESYTGNGHALSTVVVTATPAQTTRVLDAVVQAVKSSGHPASALAFGRDTPLSVDEPSGVKLGLTLLATIPVTRSDRVRAIVAGVNAMSIEESYYWYAKCVGRDGHRAKRALRVLLAEE